MIGYDPPAGATNPNDPQAGDSTVDAGVFFVINLFLSFCRFKCLCIWSFCRSGGGGAEEGNEIALDGDPTAPPGVSLSPSKQGNLRQRMTRSSQSRQRLANKPQDFQVSVTIITSEYHKNVYYCTTETCLIILDPCSDH